MKKISIFLFAAAVFALIGCAKNDGESQTKTYKRTVTVNVTKGADTKTAVNEGTTASYVWTEGDDQYFHVYENETEGTVENVTYTDKMKTATLTVSFDTPEGTTNFVYSAKFCKELSGSGNPKINANQSPAENSYDPAADVMIAEDISSQTALTSLQFSMDRKVSVNKMTLTGLVAGEKISKVEITFDKSVAGHYTGGDENPYSLNVKKLTLSYPDIAVPAGGSFPVYFVVAPNENIAFESVIVTTDQHVYTKNTSCNPNPFEGKTITFACGKFTRFNMGMAGYDSDITSGTQYTLVESQEDLFSGATYLVVGNSSNTSKLYALGEQRSNNRAGVEVVDNNNVITIDNTIAAHPVIIEKVGGNYTLKDASSNLYLYTNSQTANRLQSKETIDDYAKWTISINDGVSIISNVGNTSHGKLCFNPTWQNNSDTNPLFAGYATVPSNGTDNLALYVDLSTCIVKADPELSYSTDSYNINLGDAFTTPTLSNPHNLTVTYSSSNTSVASVNSSTGAVTIVGAGTVAITASFAGNDTYKSGSASYTINIIDSTAPTEYTLYSETFGTTATANTPSADYTGWSWSGSNHPVGWKVSNNNLTGINVSTDAYEGASGSCNLFSGTANDQAVISFGDVSEYSDVTLSFGWANGAGKNKPRTMKVEISKDGSNWTEITFTTSSNNLTNDGFHLCTYSISDSYKNNLSVRFTNTAGNTSRVDDVKLVGKK